MSLSRDEVEVLADFVLLYLAGRQATTDAPVPLVDIRTLLGGDDEAVELAIAALTYLQDRREIGYLPPAKDIVIRESGVRRAERMCTQAMLVLLHLQLADEAAA